MEVWNSSHYLKFDDERTRAAVDLSVRIQLETPTSIVDLTFLNGYLINQGSSQVLNSPVAGSGMELLNMTLASRFAETFPTQTYNGTVEHFSIQNVTKHWNSSTKSTMLSSFTLSAIALAVAH